MYQVVKRNNKVVDFDISKISTAIISLIPECPT